MATRRTKEEKLKLIADYEASSLSMTESKSCMIYGMSKRKIQSAPTLMKCPYAYLW